MKNTVSYIAGCLLLLAVLFQAPSFAQGAQQADLAAQTQRILLRINEARTNPRTALARLGISEASARAVLGQDAWILDQGLPPQAINQQLQLSAASHGSEVLGTLHYSYLSLDGRTPQERIAATGYPALQSAESMVALTFDTYVGADMAADSLVDAMLRDELTGSQGVGRNIFSGFSEVGITLQADSSAQLFPGRPYAYLLIIDFGQAADPNLVDLHEQGFLLWQQINAARANPRAAMARLGLTERRVRSVLGDEAWILDTGLPPLAWNDRLHDAALLSVNRKHNGFLGQASLPAVQSSSERVSATGYQAAATDETILVHVCDVDFTTDADIQAALTDMVDTLIRQELTGAFWVRRNIFSAGYNEVGISPREVGDALLTEAEAGMPNRPDVYLLAFDFAAPQP